MKALLQQISKLAIQIDEEAYYYLESPWLGEAPATAAAIKQLEAELKVELPEDYKSFLRITNGFESPTETEPFFMAAEFVVYLKDFDPELIQIWRETGNEEIADDLEKGILIAGQNDEQQFLLIPPDVQNSEWRYWKFAHWIPGEEPYENLTDYFESVLEFQKEILEEQKEAAVSQLTEAEKAELKSLDEKVQSIMQQYEKEYGELEAISFQLHIEQEQLKQKYGALDKITGLSTLFKRIAELHEKSEE